MTKPASAVVRFLRRSSWQAFSRRSALAALLLAPLTALNGADASAKKPTFALPDKNANTAIPGLYDLSKDISESHDLAAAQPERAKQLQADRAKRRKHVIWARPIWEVEPKAANDAP